MKIIVDIDKAEDINVDFDMEKYAVDCAEETLRLHNFPSNVSISLSIVHDATIAELNVGFRGIESATDVLSFPMYEFGTPGDYSSIQGLVDTQEDILLGDIVISMDHCKNQAVEFGHSLIREFSFLIVHSVLHLIGYDHVDLDDARNMEQMQKEVLNNLNITR